MEKSRDNIYLVLAESKTFEEFNSHINKYNFSGVGITEEDGACVFYLLTHSGNFRGPPEIWAFYFDNDKDQMIKEDWESIYGTHHRERFNDWYKELKRKV